MVRITRDEVALRAGVSAATVSRVLNSRSGTTVSEVLRTKVHLAAKQIGYRPNSIARALVTGKTYSVAAWAMDSFTPYYSMIGRYIAQQALSRHYQVLLNSLEHYADDLSPVFSSFSRQVDGILACDIESARTVPSSSPNGVSLDHIRSLYGALTPRVSMGVFHTDLEDFVGIDLYQSTVEAIQHLIRPGCRRIAYMRNNAATSVRDARTRAYEDVMHEAGLDCEYIKITNQQRHVARQMIVEYVREFGLPEGIFCINDDVALGCYRGLCDLGVRLPEDIALVGCDGLSELEYLETPISTIVQPLEGMVEQAWEFLELRMQNPATPVQQRTLSAKLTIRASSLR